jgi:hypothetical protein
MDDGVVIEGDEENDTQVMVSTHWEPENLFNRHSLQFVC